MSGFPSLKAMGIAEAAEAWNLKTEYVEKLCEEGKIKALRIENTWLIYKNQPNPNQE
ncbi:MAG: hypothetical protein HGA27_05140 [Peptococcaceae bacterium]|nr:hypothetical protein [Peptococcaceae bacterium]